MFMKVIKVLWFVAAFCVLLVTLYAFDGKPNSDISVFLTWMMLILSFPASLAVSLAHMLIGAYLSVTIETSYVSLALEWSAYFALGYIQWFVFLPYLIRKISSIRKQF